MCTDRGLCCDSLAFGVYISGFISEGIITSVSGFILEGIRTLYEMSFPAALQMTLVQ